MTTFLFHGGLNENDGTRLEECQEGYNFDLIFGDTDFRPRRSLDTKGTATLGGAISGIMQLIQKDDTETTLIFEDDGVTPTIYQWNGSTTFTSKRTTNLAIGSKLRDVYFALDDTLSIVDIAKLTPLMAWDGTTLTRHKTGVAAGNPASVTSITRSGSTATVTTAAAHGRATGDLVHIAGAVETAYNGEYEITVTGASEFTYTVVGSPTTPATGTITWDFGVEIYAKYGIIHNGRLWLFNITTDDGATSIDLPHLMVASEFEDIQSFDTAKRNQDSTFSTGSEAFYMLSSDLKPINGVAVFNKQLIISTLDGKLYRLAGNDSTNYQWFDYYAGSAAIGTETMVNMGNDVIYMKKGGHIDTLIATDTSGDVSTDEASHWIPDTVIGLSDAITVYDQTLQKVLFFVTDKVLVFYKEPYYGYQRELSPWSIYKTALTNSFNTNAARYLRRPGEATYSVYWGDASGNIYDLNGVGQGDNGDTTIDTVRKSNVVDTLDSLGGILFGRVRFRRIGACEMNITVDWSDEYNEATATVPLSGPPAGDVGAFWGGDIYWGGDAYWSQGFAFSDKVTNKNFSTGGRAESFIISFQLDTDVRFKVDRVELGLA